MSELHVSFPLILREVHLNPYIKASRYHEYFDVKLSRNTFKKEVIYLTIWEVALFINSFVYTMIEPHQWLRASMLELVDGRCRALSLVAFVDVAIRSFSWDFFFETHVNTG